MILKKITAAFLCLSMSASLIACGEKEVKPNNAANTQAATSAPTNAVVKIDTGVDEIVKKRAKDYDLSTITTGDFVKAMGLGWNLGNTLDATGGDGTDPIKQETSWGNPEITPELFQGVADAGFTTVRIPVTWFHFTDPTTYKIDEKMLARVQQVVDWALDANLFVILNIHHDNRSANGNEGWLSPKKEYFASSQAQLCEMWSQIADRFKDYDLRLIFEGMNEPRVIGAGNAEWTGTNETWLNVNLLGLSFVDTVRESGGNNAKRFLMVPCYAATSNSNAWKSYEFPDNDDRVIMSIHAYSPYDFALNTNGTGSWSSSNAGDTREIEKLFSDIKSILIDKGHYAVIGEFGAVNKNNLDARNDWAKFYATKAAEIGIPIVWWDNNAFSGNGENFGLFRRTVNKVLFKSIMEELLSAWYGTEFHYPAEY